MLRRKKILAAVLAGLFALGGASTATARGVSSSDSSLLSAINSVRASHGLAALRVDVRLTKAARSHSVDMVKRQYFAHGSVGARVLAFRARGPVFGENLAWSSAGSVQQFVSMWLASPGHRANLLRPGFRRVGISAVRGTFAGKPGSTVVTADFAGT